MEGRIYNVMVQAVADNALHGKFTDEERKTIKGLTVKHPVLDATIADKVAELNYRSEEHQKMLDKRTAHKERQAESETEARRY